jgi:hypothetical protein
MIFGNPYKFAIHVDIVEDWCSDGFVEGLFFYMIDGSICPRTLPNVSQNISFQIAEIMRFSRMEEFESRENPYYFNLPAKEAFQELVYLSHITLRPDYTDDMPDEWESWRHLIWLEDLHFPKPIGDIFLVTCGLQEKILYKDPETGLILETILEKNYVVSVMQEAIGWWNSLNIARVAPISKA